MNICKGCENAKDFRGESCYCLEYGIIIGYPKNVCKGFEPTVETKVIRLEQIQKQKNGN